MTLHEEAMQFVEKLLDPAAPEQEIRVAGITLYKRLTATPLDESEDAMAVVANAISDASDGRAHVAATICGAIVEGGASPERLAGPLLRRLRVAVPQAQQF